MYCRWAQTRTPNKLFKAAFMAFYCGVLAGPCYALDFSAALKGGGVTLSSQDQTFEGQENSFDSMSSQAFALAWDVRHPRLGFAIGMEYLHYVNPYHSSLFAGKASTRALLLTGKYFFFRDRTFRPFAGLGIGQGYTSNHSEDANAYGDCTSCVAVRVVQLSGGFEWGGRPLALITEIKALAGLDGINTDSGGHFDSGYKASGLGLFTGIRVLF